MALANPLEPLAVDARAQVTGLARTITEPSEAEPLARVIKETIADWDKLAPEHPLSLALVLELFAAATSTGDTRTAAMHAEHIIHAYPFALQAQAERLAMGTGAPAAPATSSPEPLSPPPATAKGAARRPGSHAMATTTEPPRPSLRTGPAVPALLSLAPADLDPFALAVHPAAATMPRMTADEKDGLLADVREHGLLEPLVIVKHDGHWTLLDGRHRRDACQQLGIVPSLRALGDGQSAVQYVISKNLHRRNMTASQRALAGAELEPMLAEEAKVRMLRGKRDPEVTWPQGQLAGEPTMRAPQARAVAAAAAGSSETSVRRAKVVVQAGAPEVVEAVRQGQLTVHVAQDLSGLPRKEQTTILTAAMAASRRQPGQLDKLVAVATKKAKHAAASSQNEEDPERQPVFDDVPELRAASKQLRAASKVLTDLLRGLETGPGPDIAPILPVVRAAQAAVAPLAERIDDVIPSKVCGECAGAGCETCDNTGWLPRSGAHPKSVVQAKSAAPKTVKGTVKKVSAVRVKRPVKKALRRKSSSSRRTA